MFSIELPESLTSIGGENHWRRGAFENCKSLRNLAIPPDAEVGDNTFQDCIDLRQRFDTRAQLTSALKQRFDNLPIHKMIYYHSYNNLTPEQLSTATDMRSGQSRSLRSRLDLTGNQQDCLGMTPLHILACSSVQNIELYKVLIEKYPSNLITKDRWGTLPLLYAVWRNPNKIQIVKFMMKKYQAIYPNYELNWTKMMETLVKANVSFKWFRVLHHMQRKYFPNQCIDWDVVLEVAVSDIVQIQKSTFIELIAEKIRERVMAIRLNQLRHCVCNKVDDVFETVDGGEGRRDVLLTEVQSTLTQYENEYHKLKEATASLELVLWKKRMNENLCEINEKRRIKKRKIAESDVRNQCRITCGAGIVIKHVLPYLLPQVDAGVTH